MKGPIKLNGRLLYATDGNGIGSLPLPWSKAVGSYYIRGALVGEPLTSVDLTVIDCCDPVLNEFIELLCEQELPRDGSLRELCLCQFLRNIKSLDRDKWLKFAAKCQNLQALSVKGMAELEPACRSTLSQFIVHVLAARPPLRSLTLNSFSRGTDVVGVVEILQSLDASGISTLETFDVGYNWAWLTEPRAGQLIG